MVASILRNLLRASFTAPEWIDSDDATRNAMFGYLLGQLNESGGDANDVELTLLHPDGFTALQRGALGWTVPDETNTGPMTVNIGGIGAVALRDRSGNALTGGEVVAGKAFMMGYYDNGTDPAELRIMGDAGNKSSVPKNFQLLTASGTYTPTAGTSHIIVIAQAAGGGGGGIDALPSMAGNGGAGETRFGVFENSGNVAVTIGAAGAGGAAGANDGGTASDLVFGALMTAKGGTGGTYGSTSAAAANGSTPTGSGGTRLPPDENDNYYDAGSNHMWQRTAGTLFGQGTWDAIFAGGTQRRTGKNGINFGVAGMGAFATGGSTRAGGDGGPGAVLIFEFGQ